MEIKTLIMLFLLIVIGSTFISVLGDQNWLQRNTYPVNNETLSSVSNKTGGEVDIDHHPLASILYVTNATGAYALVPASNYTITTGSVYNMYNGKFLLNSAHSYFHGEDLNISYTYYPQGYVRQSIARTLLNLIPLFFALAILLFVIVPVLRKWDIF